VSLFGSFGERVRQGLRRTRELMDEGLGAVLSIARPVDEAMLDELEETLIAAGSVVLEGTRVPPRSFVAGVPASVRGPIPDPIRATLLTSAANYVALAREHAPEIGAHIVDAAAEDIRIGPREVDVLEDAERVRPSGARPGCVEPLVVDPHDLARLDVAQEAQSNNTDT